MKKYLFLFIPVIFVLNTFAQSGRGYVNLKNGSKIKGRILSRNDKGDVIIKSHGNIWNFQSSAIDTIFYSYDETVRTNVEEETSKKKNDKLFNQAEVGFLVANPDNEQDLPFSFHYSLNYKATYQFSVGAGAGVEFIKETHLPVFLHLQYTFRNELFSPLIFLKTGYRLSVDESRTNYYGVVPDNYYRSSYWPGDIYYTPQKLSSKGGVILNPGVGFRGMFSRSFGVSCTFGYRYSRLRYTGDDSYKID
ncbi:MAG TPA: hypothetical protein VKA38_02150, partial [Draconibacterium sp.]|nr:hypothetical protein [Draconibacterium sp.]